MKNEVLISYLQSLFPEYQCKAEFSTNDDDKKIIVVQEQPGQKIVFFGDTTPLFNYYQITIGGLKMKENYTTANTIGNLIGKHVLYDYKGGKWQIIFKQYSNPQALEYMDIRRVDYIATLQCIVNQVA
jgi:hypothetical protein